MRRASLPVICIVTLLLTVAGPVLAQYEEGQQAFDSGDYGKAQAAWQKGAEAGDARCQYSLGYMAQFGLGAAADTGAARSWYEKAAAAKNADALYALGLMFETGQAGEKDLTKAFDYYRQAAAAGPQPDAEYAVGRMLLRGRGVPRNARESIVWLKKAAQHNNPSAQYMLAASYEAGWGVPVDEAQAYYWYRRADLGDPVELEEQDVAFAPKIAIAALRKVLPADEIAEIDARIAREKKTPPAKPAKPLPALTKPAN